ncbi:sulfotransferase 1A2 [Lingula anatina]|uniref:Sulfotransferase 1A2 n=1 Tax=Lingula anatina TaxID=7574 RepID=A0A1S3K415_LINAN|nr:sulfotransferase 1A2 [Lingula anatina]|eukprot:XP_013417154.1 sulfotransferase 1A2 [Lingula anatina]
MDADTADVYREGKVVRCPDGNGDIITLKDTENINGIVPFDRIGEISRNFCKFPLRKDDIFLTAFVRSGTHVVWEITTMLTKNMTELTDLPKQESMIELMTDEALESLPSPRVLNNHFPNWLYPKEALTKNKFIHVIRNPKDALVSYYHMAQGLKNFNYSGTWSGYFEFVMARQNTGLKPIDYNDWPSNVLPWYNLSKTNQNIVNVFFEDLVENPVPQIKRIAEHIGFPKDQDTYEQIAKATSFKAVRQNKRVKGLNLQYNTPTSQPWKDGSPGIYRKGKVGDWKNHFTVAQNERFDALYRQWTLNTDICVRFEI